MPLWTLTKEPEFKQDAIATPSGWTDPVTGEVLVAIRQLVQKRQEFVDEVTDNLSLESGFNLLLEQEESRPLFLVLE